MAVDRQSLLYPAFERATRNKVFSPSQEAIYWEFFVAGAYAQMEATKPTSGPGQEVLITNSESKN